MPDMPVSELIERAKTGVLDAFDELIKLYRVKAYGLAFSFVKNHPDAEDVSQEAFIKVFKNLNSFDPSAGSFDSWLFTIVANLARNKVRWKSVRERLGFSLDHASDSRDGDKPALQVADPDPAADPAAAADRTWESKRIADAMGELPEQQQVAIYLKFIHGYKITEIAGLMGLAEGTVKSHIFRGLDRLKKVLEEESKTHAV